MVIEYERLGGIKQKIVTTLGEKVTCFPQKQYSSHKIVLEILTP